jgi:hypothetical protein
MPTAPGTLRIQHREPFLTVSCTFENPFESHTLFNPGDLTQMPWFGQLAGAFDRYKVNALEFEWAPECGASTNGALVISPDRDCTDPNPTNSLVARTALDAVGGAIWSPIVCRITMAGEQPNLLVRHGPPDGDYHLYDFLKLHVYGTTDTAAAKGGQLWVKYDITLSVPDAEADNTSIFSCSASAWPTLLEGTSPIKTVAADGANTKVTVGAGKYRFISPTTIASIVGATIVDRVIGAGINQVHDYLVSASGPADISVTLTAMAVGFALTIIDKACTLFDVA